MLKISLKTESKNSNFLTNLNLNGSLYSWKGYDFFTAHYKDGKYKSYWIMSEGRTRLKMFEGQTKQHLLQEVRYGLKYMTKKHLNALIKYYTNQYGISPRYKTIK